MVLKGGHDAKSRVYNNKHKCQAQMRSELGFRKFKQAFQDTHGSQQKLHYDWITGTVSICWDGIAILAYAQKDVCIDWAPENSKRLEVNTEKVTVAFHTQFAKSKRVPTIV